MAEDPKPEEIRRLMEELKDWFNKQTHLSNSLGDLLLRRFLHSCYYDIEITKNTIELFFSIRASTVDLISNRDPQSPHVQKAFKITNLAQLRISDNRNVFIWQLNDPGLENYDYAQDARLFFLTTDAWLLADDDRLEDGDIVIMDVKDISLKFLTKFNISIAKKISKYQEDAMPIRLKQIHLINVPPFIDKIFGLMKPFLRPDIVKMIHFHTPKSETLHQYIDKAELPEDYGGTNGKMEDHMKLVVKLINDKREALMQENLWVAINKDKKSKSKAEIPSEVTSSFRTLDID